LSIKAESDLESSLELLERARAGDAAALDRLLTRYLAPLRRWARGRLPRWARDLSDTEDLVQETLFQTLRHIGTFRPEREGALQAYLRQAVMNRIRDELRRVRRRPAREELAEDVASAMTSPLDEAIGAEATDRYEAALASLREEEREAIIARVEFEQSYEKIAALLGKPSPDAARMAVQRALVRLAVEMNHVK
jgi:RNA polymerase sigma factor (sigma-70 family)